MAVASDDDVGEGDDFEDFWSKIQKDVESRVLDVPDEEHARADTFPDTLVVLDSPAKPLPTPASDRAEPCQEGDQGAVENCEKDDEHKGRGGEASGREGDDSEVLDVSDDDGSCNDTAGDDAPTKAKGWTCKCGHPPEECSCERLTALKVKIASVKAQIAARILQSALK